MVSDKGPQFVSRFWQEFYRQIGGLLAGGGTVTISVGAALLLLSWSTWPFVLTAHHVLRCHCGVYSAPLVVLFANSPSSPALYFVLIISPLSCLVSVRNALFWSSDHLAAVVLSDPVSFCLFFLVLSVWHSCFCNPSFFYMPASLGLWSALCLGFSLPVCPSLHSNPSPIPLCSCPAPPLDFGGGYCLSPPLCPCWLGWSDLIFALCKWTICW